MESEKWIIDKRLLRKDHRKYTNYIDENEAIISKICPQDIWMGSKEALEKAREGIRSQNLGCQKDKMCKLGGWEANNFITWDGRQGKLPGLR